jgi:transposase InsO family protein
LTEPQPTKISCFAKRNKPVSAQLWHERLAHVNSQYLARLQAMGSISMSPETKCDAYCNPCLSSKLTRAPFHASSSRTTRPGELVFSDLAVLPCVGRGGWRYFVTYIDHYTRHTTLYLLRSKSDQFEALKQYHATISTKFKGQISKLECLQSDNGGEYISRDMQQFLTANGIHHRTIVAGNPESNGLPERLNRSIMEAAQAIRLRAGLPQDFWPFSVRTAVYLLNRRPHAALKDTTTPYEAWHQCIPDLSHLRVFGCDAWMLIPSLHRSKLDSRSRRVIFVGYCSGKKAYELFCPIDDKTYVSRDVIFNEKSFSLALTLSTNNTPQESKHLYYCFDPVLSGDENQIASPTLPAGIQQLENDVLEHNINQYCDSEIVFNNNQTNQDYPDEINLNVAPNPVPDISERPVRRSSRIRRQPGEFCKIPSANFTTSIDTIQNNNLPRPALQSIVVSKI